MLLKLQVLWNVETERYLLKDVLTENEIFVVNIISTFVNTNNIQKN